MTVQTTTQAKAQLSALIELALQGEEILIKRGGKPVTVLRAYSEDKSERRPGTLRGKIRIAEDFDASSAWRPKPQGRLLNSRETWK